MRKLLWGTLVGAAVVMTMTTSIQAQGYSGTTGAPELGVVYAGSITSTPAPVFSSPDGLCQGYGYYPAMYWRGAGGPLYFKVYSDGTISHPDRPGSTNFYPSVGYFAMGDGPYVFPIRW